MAFCYNRICYLLLHCYIFGAKDCLRYIFVQLPFNYQRYIFSCPLVNVSIMHCFFLFLFFFRYHITPTLIHAEWLFMIYVSFCCIIGIKSAVLERNITFSKHPQAHFINNRSMEVKFLLHLLSDRFFFNKYTKAFVLTKSPTSDIPQNWWSCWENPKLSTTGGFMEEVCVLYFSLWFNSWICGPHQTSRCYSVVWEPAFESDGNRKLTFHVEFWQIFIYRLLVV